MEKKTKKTKNTKKIIKSIFAVSLISLIFLSFMAVGDETFKERGRYIYDDANRLSQESYLGLSAYLWKLDIKTGYEIVLVFPKENLTVEQMGNWFNNYGVGKKGKDNGLALFIFPDNSAFGMIGRGNDKIAVPYVSTYGGRTLKGLNKEPVLAILSFLNVLDKKIDTPTTFDMAENFGKTAIDNIDIILLWASLLALIIFLYQVVKYGIHMDDLKIPAVILVITFFVVGIMAIGVNDTPSSEKEYGVITSTHPDSYTYYETHCTGTGKTETCWTELHTRYTNDVKVLSYDFREYQYRFSSTDSKWAWERQNGELLEMTVNLKNKYVDWVNTPVHDNSGGQTDNYGTWIAVSKLT